MRVIVTSQADIAGRNIYEKLARSFGFAASGEFEGKAAYKRENVLLIATRAQLVEAEHLDDFFDAEYYVFASRHRSESNERTLTVHVTGNLADRAELGGRPKQLAHCDASAMKAALLELQSAKEELQLDYKVSFEATHHGPTSLKKPVLFVEVGSTEKEWCDAAAVKAVARAALAAAKNVRKFPCSLGIGGGHYAPLHTRAALESEVAIGHIIPTYAIDALQKEVLEQAVQKTQAEFGFLDWKGMRGEQRSKIIAMAKEINLELKRGRDVLK